MFDDHQPFLSSAPIRSPSHKVVFFCRWPPGWMTHWALWRPNWSTAPRPSPSCRASASCRCTAVPSIPAPSWRTASTGGGCYIVHSAAVTGPLPERGARPSPIIPFCFRVPNTDSVPCSESVFGPVIQASSTWQKHLWKGNLQLIESLQASIVIVFQNMKTGGCQWKSCQRNLLSKLLLSDSRHHGTLQL